MSTFWQLLKESVIIQGVMALLTLMTVLYLYATGQPVPTELYAVFTLILGYYFGAKNYMAQRGVDSYVAKNRDDNNSVVQPGDKRRGGS